MSHVRKSRGELRWEGVEIQEYKTRGERFRSVTRQLLAARGPGFEGELRYFEIAAGGHSTLERHAHAHAVVIVLGRGRVLVGEEIASLDPFDLVRVPPWTWHQFRAATDAPLGFICVVDGERDRPAYPQPEELAAMRRKPSVSRFIRL